MSDVFAIADILVEHAVQTYGDEIAIIAYYGSYAKGTASPTSDLDIFYIPEPGKARALSSQFVIEGRPYDFWPVSWALAEEIADATTTRPWVLAASLLIDAKVLYQRSTADLERFRALQARTEALTEPPQRRKMIKQALVEFQQTLFQLGQIRLAVAAADLVGRGWAVTGLLIAPSTRSRWSINGISHRGGRQNRHRSRRCRRVPPDSRS